MKNVDIRREIAAAGIRMWQVAKGLGIADTTFCCASFGGSCRRRERRVFLR